MSRDAQRLVEIFGPCSVDIRVCEIMRTAIVLKDSEPANEQAQAIRQELAKLACEDCVLMYLPDVS